MSSAPVLGSYTITDMGSNKAWRVTIDRPQASSEPGDTTAPAAPAEAVQRVDTVQISREALARYHAHAIDRIRAGQTATNPVTLSAGTRIEDPNALSEEERQAPITVCPPPAARHGRTGATGQGPGQRLQGHEPGLGERVG